MNDEEQFKHHLMQATNLANHLQNSITEYAVTNEMNLPTNVVVEALMMLMGTGINSIPEPADRREFTEQIVMRLRSDTKTGATQQ